MFTAMNFQLAGLSTPKLPRVFYTSLTPGTFQSLGMKMLQGPLSTIFLIKQSFDWKFHLQSLSPHALPLHMSQQFFSS